MFGEFRAFLLKTNALALAIGVIIGGALGTVVDSLVNDIIMPPVGLLLGNADFSDLFVNLDMSKSFASVAEAEAAGAPIIKYGLFINTVLDFMIVAFVIFMVIRGINKLQRKREAAPPPPPPPPSTEVVLLAEIRDLLRKR